MVIVSLMENSMLLMGHLMMIEDSILLLQNPGNDPTKKMFNLEYGMRFEQLLKTVIKGSVLGSCY
jgi:hypothetical protein